MSMLGFLCVCVCVFQQVGCVFVCIYVLFMSEIQCVIEPLEHVFRHDWQAYLRPLCSNVWEASGERFLPVFSTQAIINCGNANGCFDSHGQGLKHLFY